MQMQSEYFWQEDWLSAQFSIGRVLPPESPDEMLVEGCADKQLSHQTGGRDADHRQACADTCDCSNRP